MNFTIQCYASNPLSAFPTIRPRGTLQGSAAVTCLLAPLPSVPNYISHLPKIHFSQYFSIIVGCLLITGSLFTSTLFSGPLWLKGNASSAGLQTHSCPIDLLAIQQTLTSGELLPFHSYHDEHYCSPQKAKSFCPTLFLSTGAPNSPDEVAPNRLFTANLLVHSNKGSAYLPHNKMFGVLYPQTPDDLLSFYNASNHTAQYLAESWYSYTLSQRPVSFSATLDDIISMSTQANTSNSSRILPPFLSPIASDMAAQETSFPTTETTPRPSALPPPPNSATFPELASIAKELGKYLNSSPSKSVISLQVCKFIYVRFPASRQLLATNGKLRSLVKAFSYLSLEGGTHGGTYILSLNSDLFHRVV